MTKSGLKNLLDSKHSKQGISIQKYDSSLVWLESYVMITTLPQCACAEFGLKFKGRIFVENILTDFSRGVSLNCPVSGKAQMKIPYTYQFCYGNS